MTGFAQVRATLRRQNRGQYLLLFACIFLSVLLITSFAVIMRSNTVQRVLPEGGDSRKQMMMVFSIAVVGCGVFTTYASSLFFHYKSRETGIFMALGASRRVLRRALLRELAALSLLGSGLGMLCGTPLSAGIWALLRLAVIDSSEMRFSIHPSGYLWGAAFSLFTVAALFLMGLRFAGRTSILDVVNRQRKSEPIRDVKGWYGWAGALMMATGAFGGYMLPHLFIQGLRQPPLWTNLVYVLVPIGLYLLLIHLVIRGHGGKHPYRNIVSRSMMKFQGRQTVRNMCVIAMLVAGAYFAMFYIPVISVSAMMKLDSRPYDFAYFHQAGEDLPDRAEVEAMALEEGIALTRWQDVDIADLAVDGYSEKWLEDGTISIDYQPIWLERSMLCVGDFNRISGQEIRVSPGAYLLVTALDQGGSHTAQSDVTRITNPVTKEVLPVSYQGSVVFSHMDGYVILANEDLARITAGLTDEWRTAFHLFDVDDPGASYPFARRLKAEIVERSSEASQVHRFYDRVSRMTAHEAGEPYWMDEYPGQFAISYDNPDAIEFNMGWRYIPQFRILDKNDFLLNLSVFLMLFAFISIICFSAVMIIAYTRCMTIGLNNRQVYEDIRRLGAGRNYLYTSIRGQVSKVFLIPALIGSTIIYLFFAMILYFNSGGMEPSEWVTLAVNLAVVAATSLALWAFYRFTLRKVCGTLGIVPVRPRIKQAEKQRYPVLICLAKGIRRFGAAGSLRPPSNRR